MDLQLTGSRVLVTGGTRGLGRAIVEAFATEGAAEGAVVEFCARRADEIEETEQVLAGAQGAVRGTVVDVADGPGLIGWVQDVAERRGGIDAVVSNVSALATGPSEADWYASFEVDLMGAVRLVTAALPHLEASGNGSIIARSSVRGREADFAAGPYGTMRTALVGFVSGLALQLAGRRVRANVVSPGNTYFEGGFWQDIEQGDPELFGAALGLNPTGRMGKPGEMARAAVFLSSPVSSFTSGTHLVVDGALTRGVQL